MPRPPRRAPPAAREGLRARLCTDSTTLGVRVMEVERVALRRRLLPEYEAYRQLAEEHGLSRMEVYRLVPAEKE